MCQLRVSIRHMVWLSLKIQEYFPQSCKALVNMLGLLDSYPFCVGSKYPLRPCQINKTKLAMEDLSCLLVISIYEDCHDEMRSWALFVELGNSDWSIVAGISQSFEDLVFVGDLSHYLGSIHVTMRSFKELDSVGVLIFLKKIFDLLVVNLDHTNLNFILYSILFLLYNIINFVNCCEV